MTAAPLERSHVESRCRGPVLVVQVRGDVDLDSQLEIEAAITRSLRTMPVVVDLHDVPFFAISGLGMLLRCRRAGLAYGHPLILAQPRPQLLRLVRAANLTGQLPRFRTLETACARATQIDRARNPGTTMRRTNR